MGRRTRLSSRARVGWAALVAGALLLAGLTPAEVASASSTSARSGTAAAATLAAAEPSTGGTFTPVTPARVLDTRRAIGVPGTSRVPAGGRVAVSVLGRAGLPASGVAAVSVTVTVTDTAAPGYLVGYASGTTRPLASTLNWATGDTVANAALLPVGADGRVVLENGPGGSASFVMDVQGWYSSGAVTTAGGFRPTVPTRVLDTRHRIGTDLPYGLGPDQSVPVPVPPSLAGAAAVALNVTAVGVGFGHLVVGGYFQDRVGGSVVTWTGSRTVAALVIAPVTDGHVVLQAADGYADVVVDLVGSVAGGAVTTGGTSRVELPYRQADTRLEGLVPGTPKGPLAAGTTGRLLPQDGPLQAYPGSISAVVVSVTVPAPAADGYLTAWSGRGTRPTTSMLNWRRGRTTTGTVVVPLGSDGQVAFTNGSAGPVDLIVDLLAVVVKDVPLAPGWSATSVPGSTVPVGVTTFPTALGCSVSGTCAMVSRQTDMTTGSYSVSLRRWASGSWSVPVTTTYGYTTTSGGAACSPGGMCAAYLPLSPSGGQGLAAVSTPTHGWVLDALPVPTGADRVVGFSATCELTVERCWVVGTARTSGGAYLGYAAVTDGSSWRIVDIPALPSGPLATVNRIVCASTGCTAVVRSSTAYGLATWDGSTWTTFPYVGPEGTPAGGLTITPTADGTGVALLGQTTTYGPFFSGTWSHGQAGPTTTMAGEGIFRGQLGCPADGGPCVAEGQLASSPDGSVLMDLPQGTPTTVATPFAGRVPFSAQVLSCGSRRGCVSTSGWTWAALADRGAVLEQQSGTWSSALLPNPADAVEGTVPQPISGASERSYLVSCWGGSACLSVDPYLTSGQRMAIKAVVRPDGP